MRYICGICGYVYDDAAEKVPFASLPETWTCPLCGAPKSAFSPEATPEPVPKAPEQTPAAPIMSDSDGELQKLTEGQLAALFSSLARGCEKQYKPEAAARFRELAAYYTARTPAEDASVEALASLLKADLASGYPNAADTADRAGDRGAKRICVWGEKVTRMLSVLAERYRKEGDALLAHTQIFVCTVCGFVYIGDEAPALCPVCKVPAWKFEKIEGKRA